MFRHALVPLTFGILIALLGQVNAATIAVGETVEGALTESSPSEEGKFEETYTLPLTEGQIVVIDLMSSAFDPYLKVTTPNGDELENDDGGEDINSRLVFLAETDGDAEITATSYGSGSTGAFTLSVTEPELQEIVAGEPFTGTLDGVAGHTMRVNADEVLVIDLTSDDFDTILSARGPDGTTIENDDISRENRNSRIIFTPARSGTAILTVSSYTGAGGEYTLLCTALNPDQWIEWDGGDSVSHQGELTLDSAEALIGIQAPAESPIQIDVTSEDFDPVITVFSDAGWSETDDDGGENMNSLLQVDVPPSGKLYLQVSSYSGSGAGSFTVALGSQVAPIAPAFSLETVTGDVITSDQFDGRIRIIDFWATWCPPCVAEVPHFNEITDEYGDRGVSVIGISLDMGSDAVTAFLDEHAVDYTIVMDDGATSAAFGELTEDHEIRYIPTTFVVDRDGSIVSVHTGYSAKEVFVQEIEALLDSGE